MSACGGESVRFAVEPMGETSFGATELTSGDVDGAEAVLAFLCIVVDVLTESSAGDGDAIEGAGDVGLAVEAFRCTTGLVGVAGSAVAGVAVVEFVAESSAIA